jgi:uncharacterized Zn finger protein
MGRYGRRGYYDDFRFWGYEKTTPKEVKGGIKAQSQRGAFASSWWGKRWIEVLESFNIGARLSRGRSYARHGQVADLVITAGKIAAKVQGSRSTPYRVHIELGTLSAAKCKALGNALAENPLLAAKMLAGEWPQDLESVCRAAGIVLFPEKHKDLKTECSCPDWSNPCKHIAAVYYLVAEAFDRDPFLLFQLRGFDRKEFTNCLEAFADADTADAETQAGHTESEPLPAEPERFWRGQTEPSAPPPLWNPPALHAALIRRLGPIPFWRAAEHFQDAMTALYTQAAIHAEQVLAGPAETDGL